MANALVIADFGVVIPPPEVFVHCVDCPCDPITISWDVSGRIGEFCQVTFHATGSGLVLQHDGIACGYGGADVNFGSCVRSNTPIVLGSWVNVGCTTQAAHTDLPCNGQTIPPGWLAIVHCGFPVVGRFIKDDPRASQCGNPGTYSPVVCPDNPGQQGDQICTWALTGSITVT